MSKYTMSSINLNTPEDISIPMPLQKTKKKQGPTEKKLQQQN